MDSNRLEIEVLPADTPIGPDYDLQCLDQAVKPSIEPQKEFPKWKIITPASYDESIQMTQMKRKEYGKKKITIQHMLRIGLSYFKQTEKKIELTSDIPSVVLQFQPKAPVADFDFSGGSVTPRNLTIWLDESSSASSCFLSLDGDVKMATAFLQQKRFYLDDRIYKDERWSCAKFERDSSSVNYQNADAKEETLIFEAPFAEYHIKSAGGHQMKQDRLKIFITNRASNSRFDFSELFFVLCLFFAMISGNFFFDIGKYS